jgi:hypothetical protein
VRPTSDEGQGRTLACLSAIEESIDGAQERILIAPGQLLDHLEPAHEAQIALRTWASLQAGDDAQ